MKKLLSLFVICVLMLVCSVECMGVMQQQSMHIGISLSPVEQFLLNDATNEREYVNGSYMCGNFAEDLILNASKENITMYYVMLDYTNETKHNHMIASFYDKNSSMMYVDIYADEILNMKQLHTDEPLNCIEIGLRGEHNYNETGFMSGTYVEDVFFEMKLDNETISK